MSGTTVPLRIEIVDPVTEPLDGGWIDAVSASATSDGATEWLRSLTDAGIAARRHVDPVTGAVVAGATRVQRIVRRLHLRSVQLRNDGNPRRSSAVRQRVFEPFEDVLARLGRMENEVVIARGVTLDVASEFAPLAGGGRQARATLRIRGSWPRLPVMVKIEPWWREQTVVTVELRTRRRLRYPRRYFRCAHGAVRAVGSVVSP